MRARSRRQPPERAPRRRAQGLPLLALALWTGAPGCGCPDFGDMQIGDPDAVSTDWDQGTVAQGIADFSAWTGLDGVCVTGVDVRAEINGGLAMGRYYGPHNAIEVISGAEPSTTVHELCHAWDREHDLPSMKMPEKLPVDRITAALYPTREAQEREAFARLCERGPRGLDLLRAVEARCGLALEHPAQSWVLDQVFSETAPDMLSEGLGDLRVDALSLDGHVGDAALFGLASGRSTVVLLTRDAAAPPSADDPLDPRTSAIYRVTTIDPWTGLRRGERVFSADPSTPASALRLVDGTEAPLFLYRQNNGQTLAFRVIEQTGALVQLPTWWVDIGGQPTEAEGGGALVGEVALVPLGADAAEAQGQRWAAVDLRTGRAVDHPALEGLEDSGPAEDLYVGALPNGRIVRRFGRWQVPHAPAPAEAVGAISGVDASLAIWDPSEGWAVQELDAVDASRPLAADGEGHLLAIFDHSDLVGDYDLLETLVVGHAERPRWWLEEQACSSRSAWPRVLRSFSIEAPTGGWSWWVLLYEDATSGGRLTLSRIELEGAGG
ncbi:MAG: hypothetical protein RL071_4675 [Pseudomonadota bacterium]